MKYSELNGNEKIAYRNIKWAVDWNVGEWVNAAEDGCLDCIPDTEEEARTIIYNEALNNRYERGGCFFNQAPKEMRFAGTEFLKEAVESLLKDDGDFNYVGFEKGWW